MKCAIRVKANGKRTVEDTKRHTVLGSNITKWMAESMEKISRDRAGWGRLVRCEIRAADHHSLCHKLSFKCSCELSKVLHNFIQV